MNEQPLRFKSDPLAYLEAIERRVAQVEGVRKCKATAYTRRTSAHLVVSLESTHWQPDPVLAEAVDELRREFSAAFPDWGISCEWRARSGVKIKRVVATEIRDGRIVQHLSCGHYVRGERIRKKRRCPHCAKGER